MGLIAFTDIGILFFLEPLSKGYLILNPEWFFNHYFNYLNFNVTTAETTDKIVITQNRTAILLS